MTIINKLATSLGRRDEKPNQELAAQLVLRNDKKGVAELIDQLNHKGRDIQNDCIKVLYEIGERKPLLIAPYGKIFLSLLNHKNNRLQWGAMSALNTIVFEDTIFIYKELPKLMEAAENGTVITRDHAVEILIKLCSIKKYAEDAFTLLIEQLKNCPTNQLPMYAENAMPVIYEKLKPVFIKTLYARLDDIEKDTKRKRVEKVIKKLSSVSM